VHEGRAAVSVERGGSGFGPVEAMSLAQSPLAEAFAEITVSSHGAKLSREIVRVVGIGNQCGVTDDFAERAAVRTKHRAAASHRFNGRHAETFVERGVNAGAGGVIKRRQLCIAYETECANIAGERGLANGIVNRFRAGPILTSENELPGRIGRPFELIEGGDKAHMIFSRVFEPRDVEEKGSARLPMGTRLLMSTVISGRAESGVVQSIIDNADSVARNVEVTKDVAGRISADRDNGVLAVSQSLDGHPAIEHAEGIVLACDVKWSEVVDRGDHGAGPRVEQSAVTRDVQDIETPLAHEARQDCLVPENICDGMSKAFGDGDEFESVVEFLEKGQVAFEDEGREVMATSGREQGAEQSKDVLGNASLPPLDDGGGDANVH